MLRLLAAVLVLFGFPAIGFLVQSHIPGVKNLYAWAFPLIVFNVLFALSALSLVAEHRKRELDIEEASEAKPKPALEIDSIRTSWQVIGPYRTVWRTVHATITNNSLTRASIKQVIAKLDIKQGAPLIRVIDQDATEAAINGPVPHLGAALFGANQVFEPGDSKAGVFLFRDFFGLSDGEEVAKRPRMLLTVQENNGFMHELVKRSTPDKVGSPS